MTQSETHPLTASVLTPCLPRPLAEVMAEWPGLLAGPGALARAVPWLGTPLPPFSASQTLALFQGPERNISCSALHPHLGLGVPNKTSHGHLLEPGDPPIREVLLVSLLYTGQGARLSLPPDSAVAPGTLALPVSLSSLTCPSAYQLDPLPPPSPAAQCTAHPPCQAEPQQGVEERLCPAR